MSSAALSIVFIVTLQTVLSAPIIDGQISTRDHAKDIPSPQTEINLEAELIDRSRPHRISRLDPDGSKSKTGSSVEDRQPRKQYPVGFEEDGEPRKQYPVGSIEDKESAKQYPVGPSSDLLSEENSVVVEGDVTNLDEIENKDELTDVVKATGIPNDNGGIESRDTEGSPEEEDNVISDEEEEILRTIILTLKDNPELIKVLLQSDVEDLEDDDFSKQKAQVSGPEVGESWGTFESSEHQMPKQIEKKWGEGLLLDNKDVLGGQFLANDGIIQLPVKTQGRIYPDDEEMKADISGLDLNDEFDLSSEKPFSEENKEEVEIKMNSPPGETISISKINNNDVVHENQENEVMQENSQTKQSTKEDNVGNKVEEKPEQITPEEVPNREETAAGPVNLVEDDLLDDGFVDSRTPQSSHVNQVDSLGPVEQEEQVFMKPSGAEQNENVHHSSYNVLNTKPEQTDENGLRALSQLRRHPLAGLEEGGGVKLHM